MFCLYYPLHDSSMCPVAYAQLLMVLIYHKYIIYVFLSLFFFFFFLPPRFM